MTSLPIYCGDEAIPGLVEYCRARQLSRFLLVCDQNTHAALGQRVETSLSAQGWDVRTVLLAGAEVVADEKSVFEVLFHAGGEARTYLAVGSGTITDVARYASFCSRNAFISLPTAPSVDAYTSGGAALAVGGFKVTIPCQAPLAIFADLPTLCAAPRAMIAAGFGDFVGKYISLADWQLDRLLVGAPYDAGIAERLRRALAACVEHAAEVGRASAAGILKLMEALFESGLCMREFGSSVPASGSEHFPSHFWEVKLARERRPPVLHGTKVGLGTLLAARRYEAIRRLTRADAITRLSVASLPNRAEENERMRAAYGDIADRIIANYTPFLEMVQADLDALKERIADRWAEIQEIAAGVPSAQEIVRLLEQAGGIGDPQAAGLGEDDVQQALEYAHYLRNRFTVYWLGRVLGLS